jgi:hypothetical protein
LEDENKFHIDFDVKYKYLINDKYEFINNMEYKDTMDIIYIDLINFIINDKIDDIIDVDDQFIMESNIMDNDIIKIKENIRIYYENEDENI